MVPRPMNAPKSELSHRGPITKEWLVLAGILLAAVVLRFWNLPAIGTVFPDDLRAYAGLDIQHRLGEHHVPLLERLKDAYRISIEATGARPPLAWITAGAAMTGLDEPGELYVPFALSGVISVLLMWILARRWFDVPTALISSSMVAMFGPLVDYARSALPPSIALAFLLAGLVLATENGARLRSSHAMLVGAGACFAVAAALHPAYPLYLGIPAFMLVASAGRDGPIDTGRAEIGALATKGALLFGPFVMLIVGYDLPSLLHGVVTGHASVADLRWINGLAEMFSNQPARAGQYAGFSFLPEYIAHAGGTWGRYLFAGGALLFLISWPGSRTGLARLVTLVWLMSPILTFAVLSDFSTLGRLYGLALPAAALVVGSGLSAGVRWLLPERPKLRPILTIVACTALAAACLPYAWKVVSLPGGDPKVAEAADVLSLDRAMGFPRVDRRVFAGTRVMEVFTWPDIQTAYCEKGVRWMVLSPPDLHLIIRHRRFLKEKMNLVPVYTYPNPYRARLRMWEKIWSDKSVAANYRILLRIPFVARLGLYRIDGLTCEPQTTLAPSPAGYWSPPPVALQAAGLTR